MGFGFLSEVAQAPSCRPDFLVSQKIDAEHCSTPCGDSFHEVSSPSAFSPLRAADLVGFASPNHLRLQVFTTSWRLLPPRACRPYFMPDPLLGFSLQSFHPPAQPYAVSSATTLVTLGLFSELRTFLANEKPYLRSLKQKRIKRPRSNPVFRALLHARVAARFSGLD